MTKGIPAGIKVYLKRTLIGRGAKNVLRGIGMLGRPWRNGCDRYFVCDKETKNDSPNNRNSSVAQQQNGMVSTCCRIRRRRHQSGYQSWSYPSCPFWREIRKSLILQVCPKCNVSLSAVRIVLRRTKLLISSSALIPIPVSRPISFGQNTTEMTRTGNDNATANTIFILCSLDGHVQGGNAIIDIFVCQSGEAKFLESVIGIGYQFPKENISKVTGSGPKGKKTVFNTYLSKD